jgi:hypothetical protein
VTYICSPLSLPTLVTKVFSSLEVTSSMLMHTKIIGFFFFFHLRLVSKSLFSFSFVIACSSKIHFSLGAYSLSLSLSRSLAKLLTFLLLRLGEHSEKHDKGHNIYLSLSSFSLSDDDILFLLQRTSTSLWGEWMGVMHADEIE